MNDNAKLWVEELKSGKYLQGQGRLHTLKNGREEFCCLGVACKLYNEINALSQLPVTSKVFNGRTVFYYGDCNSQELPTTVRQWLGVDTPLGNFVDNDTYQSLALLNDKGVSFELIAEVIESEPTELFA